MNYNKIKTILKSDMKNFKNKNQKIAKIVKN